MCICISVCVNTIPYIEIKTKNNYPFVVSKDMYYTLRYMSLLLTVTVANFRYGYKRDTRYPIRIRNT